MTQISRRFLDNKTQTYIFQTFLKATSKLSSPSLTQAFWQDLLTPTEQIMLAKRLCIAYMLEKKYPQRQIGATLKLSTTTITHVSNTLKLQGKGYKQILKILLADEKIEDFFAKLDTILGKLALPPKSGNWKKFYQEKREIERKKIRPF